MNKETEHFIYADDLCITSQEISFEAVEANLTNSLKKLSVYYERNHLRANPAKTQVCSFHLRNREANRTLSIKWSGTKLSNTTHPVYLGVTLDCTLTFKEHSSATKSKVNSRNHILRKLTNSKWGASPHTLRTSALALFYSTAEYACPVWERSHHARKLDSATNNTFRITGCLKPTSTNNLHILAGIAPADIRREAASRAEKTKVINDEKHLLYGRQPPPQRLKSRRDFLNIVQPLTTSREQTRLQLWKERLKNTLPSIHMGISPAEKLPAGADLPWTQWKTLNRLRTHTGRSKSAMTKWGFFNGPTTCRCHQAEHTMDHALACPLLPSPCCTKDLADLSNNALACVKLWENIL